MAIMKACKSTKLPSRATHKNRKRQYSALPMQNTKPQRQETREEERSKGYITESEKNLQNEGSMILVINNSL
jgi:hypothetical protein